MLDVAEVDREANVIASHLAAGGGQIWDTGRGRERRNVATIYAKVSLQIYGKEPVGLTIISLNCTFLPKTSLFVFLVKLHPTLSLNRKINYVLQSL